MKLLYLWKAKYDYLNIDNGISFSPEYTIAFNRATLKITLKHNEGYIPRFYGKNIREVTAIVGANGSGKTDRSENSF